MSTRTRTRARTAGRSGSAGAWKAVWGFLRTLARVVRALRAEFGRNDPPGSRRVGPGGAALIGPKNTRSGGGRGGGLGGGGGFGRADGADRFRAFQASRPDLFGGPDMDEDDLMSEEEDALVPPMPPGYRPVGWDGRPVTDDATRAMYWARENGYSGGIDRDGRPVADVDRWAADRQAEWESSNQDYLDGGDAGSGDGGQAA